MNLRIASAFSRILRARPGKLFRAILGTWKMPHERTAAIDFAEMIAGTCGIALTPVEGIEAADFNTEAGGIDGLIVRRDTLRRAARELRDAAAVLDHAERELADSDYGEAARQARRAATELEQLLGAVP
jgi:hypothetical protein